jgi:hypothetical protein
MRVSYFFILLVFLFSSCTNDPNQNTNNTAENAGDKLVDTTVTAASEAESQEQAMIDFSQGFIRSYSGTIGENLNVKLSLTHWADGTFSGVYSYEKVGKEIELYGEEIDGRNFLLEEYVGNDQTGVFQLQFDNASNIVGQWTGSGKNESLEVVLTELKSGYTNVKWTGEWFMNDIWDGGSIIIGNETANSFDFALSFTRMGHIGSLEGTAKVSGTRASYKQVEFYGEEEACSLDFSLNEDYIDLKQNSSNIACGFGFRAFAGGKYEREFRDIKAELSFGKEDAVFLTKKEHNAFLSLVGQDFYDLFAFNMQGIDELEKDIKDRFEARVIVGAVIGMYGSNEAIIMANEYGSIWAATIKYEEDQELPNIHYFTNSESYQKSLPFTIENWRQGFAEYPIIYHFSQ